MLPFFIYWVCMELSNFIKNASSFLDESSDSSVIVLQGAVYPHIFCMQLLDSLKKELSLGVKFIDLQSGDFSFKSQLETSFLGMSCVYWLGDTSVLKPKQTEDLIIYLSVYNGPHKVILFLDSKVNCSTFKYASIITIKDRYFFDDAKMLFTSQDIHQAEKNASFLHKIYKIKKSFNVDELFFLKNYQDLLTADSHEFYESWIVRLVEADSSLFTLSQLFFEKKEQSFLMLWFNIKNLYSEMFWVSFWSDQLYRSYFFIAFTKEENFAAVKQVSFGLSFSFMKQSYRLYDLHEIHYAHQSLYEIDTSLKNGGNSYQIDQFYINFFNGKFKN